MRSGPAREPGPADVPEARRGGGATGIWSLGPYTDAFERRLAEWDRVGAARRIWEKDPSFWPDAPPSDVSGRLGWLGAPEAGLTRVDELRSFARKVAHEGVRHVVLLGMGGSSLAAQVLAHVLTAEPGSPSFRVLDSTHPLAVKACWDAAPPPETLYVVSSKSGTTLEPNVFFQFFWDAAERAGVAPGPRFVAITDPGTPLARLAEERHFRACFLAPPDVGGRYSALTVFGLVPAALAGAEIGPLLERARAMSRACSAARGASENPGLRLGAALGELAVAGRNKLVLMPDPSLRPFPAWTEQLIAESLGKRGRGIVPVDAVGSTAAPPGGRDVVLVSIGLRGERDPAVERTSDRRAADGVPVLRFELAGVADLGAELFRWELGVASCGAILGVDPFDQPDVELAKELAREAMAARGPAAGGARPPGIALDDPGLPGALDRWLAHDRVGDYVAVQAFLAPSPKLTDALAGLAGALGRRLGQVVTVGYGPRFLHSTGQLHKGGPPTGLFLQLVDDPREDLTVPGLSASFAQILHAQAVGDARALEQKHRPVLGVDLGRDPLAGVAELRSRLGD